MKMQPIMVREQIFAMIRYVNRESGQGQTVQKCGDLGKKRQGVIVRAVIAQHLDLFADLVPAGDPDDPHLILAALVGAIALARAVDDPGLSDEILDTVARTLHRHVQGECAPSAPG